MIGTKKNRVLYTGLEPYSKQGQKRSDRCMVVRRKKRKRLSYAEWRKREIERLVIYSGAPDFKKMEMLEALRREKNNAC